ncbi:MAG: ABC transporter permease [Chloroflexi bacterium]|nr:ABC transporter permease [Chloroflexota bacterium]
MNAVVLSLTARQLLSRRRTLLMAGFALLPVAVAVVFRFAGDSETDPAEFTSKAVLGALVVSTLLPLVALVMGTAALGAEIEDGTAVYLLAKPISRQEIVLSKLLPAWAVTSALVVPVVVAGGFIGMGGDEPGLVAAYAVGTALGGLVYCAIFLAASVITSRALIAGLVYVFIWENTVTRLFQGTRVLSVRHYISGVVDLLSNVPDRVLDAKLGGFEALVLMVAVGALATLYAVRRLERFEIGESS